MKIQTNDDLIDPDEFDNDKSVDFEFCPNCGRDYDEIDYEYQICHYCNFNANSK